MRRFLAVLIIAAVGAGTAAQAAEPLDEQFERLARRVDQGVGGFTGAVRPITGEIKLAYGPTLPQQHRFTTLVSTRGALVRIRVEAELTRQATAAGRLMGATTLKDFTVEHLIVDDGVTIAHEALPKGTTVMVATDHRGVTRDAAILPPLGDGTAALPQPGTRRFAEAINRFPLPVLVTETAVQNSDVFLPLTFPIGGGAGIELVRGAGPRLRGEVDCPRTRCLLVQVDEETRLKSAGRTIVARARGHLVITAGPVNLIGAFLSLSTNISQDGRTETVRSILINEQIK